LRNFEPIQPTTPLHARFGNTLELVGYELPKTGYRAGDTFSINLVWHALGATDKPYTVFVHLLDGNGRVIGQKDSPPLSGQAATDKLQPNEYVADPYEFTMSADAPVGPAALEIGFYDPVSGQRLPVSDASGNPLGDHMLIDGLQIE
jgi:hypothetical protein